MKARYWCHHKKRHIWSSSVQSWIQYNCDIGASTNRPSARTTSLIMTRCAIFGAVFFLSATFASQMAALAMKEETSRQVARAVDGFDSVWDRHWVRWSRTIYEQTAGQWSLRVQMDFGLFLRWLEQFYLFCKRSRNKGFMFQETMPCPLQPWHKGALCDLFLVWIYCYQLKTAFLS